MFLQMLKDDFPDVRLHIISKLELVNNGESLNLFVFRVMLSKISHWYRAPFTITSTRDRAASRGQAMASPVGHHRVHPASSQPAWRSILRRETQYTMHELARRHRLLHPRGSHTEPEEANRGLRRRMGQRGHNPESDGHGPTSKLPLPNDHLFCHICTFSQDSLIPVEHLANHTCIRVDPRASHQHRRY